jgi:hypothetical protein
VASCFLDPLRVSAWEIKNGRRLWRLLAPFRVLTSKGLIEVRQDFVTDLTSTPRALWSVLAPADEYLEAAIVHDLLYSAENTTFTRLDADQIFKELMFNLGVSWPRREAIYRAVRLFGGSYYQGKKP